MRAKLGLSRRALLGGSMAAALGPLGRASAAPSAWSHGTAAERDVRKGAPLTTVVLVPLCSNHQIWCGSRWAGQPAGLRSNIYWGARYGARRIVEQSDSGWTVTETDRGTDDFVLQELTLRRLAPGAPWGRADPVEQIVVMRAIHGSSIDAAVDEFHRLATTEQRVVVDDGQERRDLRLHAVGYAGHNRLMDGKRMPRTDVAEDPKPAFVLACYSERYFRAELEQVGVRPLVMTTTYVAPEGYLVSAVLRALGENATLAQLRREAISEYARYQRLPERTVAPIFSEL